MKKQKLHVNILIILAVNILLFFTANHCLALSDIGTLKLQLKVKSVFTMTVEAQDLNFGLVEPGMGNWGDIPDKDGLKIECKTNSGSDWNLLTQTTMDFTHEDQVSTMPSSTMQWMCVYAEVNGSKLNYNFSDFSPIALTSSEVYSSQKSSYASKNGYYTFQIKYLFGPVPAKSKPGKYNTTVVFTMTE